MRVDVLDLKQTPAELVTTAAPAPPFVLSRDVELTAGSVYKRVLRKGTQWTWVGRMPAGDVYRTRDQVLTVEASSMHEAYLVVAAGKATGFQLPVERAFVAPEPVVLAADAPR